MYYYRYFYNKCLLGVLHDTNQKESTCKKG